MITFSPEALKSLEREWFNRLIDKQEQEMVDDVRPLNRMAEARTASGPELHAARGWPITPDAVQSKPGAWSQQVGGGHYKSKGIQPMHYSMANNLDSLTHSVVKYVTRFREKNGVADLRKAIHCIEMLIEWEETKGNPNVG